jgi:hypothetical protein
LESLDESSKEYFSNLFPIPNPVIKFDSAGFPWDSFVVVEFGPDSVELLVARSISIPKHILESSKPCSISAPRIIINLPDNDSKSETLKEGTSGTFLRLFDVKAGSKLQVHNINGKVEISTWNQNKVRVLATVTTKGAQYKDASEVIEIKTGSTMIIRTKNIKDISVAYEIKVPQGTKVEKIITSNGQIEVYDIKGPTYISSSNGIITAENIDGDIIAETSNGTIDINKAGFIKASTSNGAISLRNIEGIEEIKTSNSKIYAEINRLKSDYTNIETSNGEIELRLSKNLDAELIASTSEGKIYTHEISKQQIFKIINREKEKYLKAKVGKGGHKEINIRTSNGNIYIKSL